MNEIVLKADPLVAADQARMFASVLADAAKETKNELLGWTGHGLFPCSLMTAEMMRALHSTLHSAQRMQVPSRSPTTRSPGRKSRSWFLVAVGFHSRRDLCCGPMRIARLILFRAAAEPHEGPRVAPVQVQRRQCR